MARKRKVSWVYAEWDKMTLANEPHDPEERLRLREELFNKCFRDGKWRVSVGDAYLVTGKFLLSAPLGPWAKRAMEVGELYFQHPDVDYEDKVGYIGLAVWLGCRYLANNSPALALVHFQNALDKNPKDARIEIWRMVPGYLSLLDPEAPAYQALVDFMNRMFAEWPSKEKSKIKIPTGATNAEVIRTMDEEEYQNCVNVSPLDREYIRLRSTECPAEQMLEALLDLRARAPGESIGSHDLAECYLILGKPQEALQAIKDDLANEPDDSAWSTPRLIACLIATGQHEEAAKVISEVFTSDKPHYGSYPIYRDLKLVRPLLDGSAPMGAELAEAFQYMLRDSNSESVQQAKLTADNTFEDLMFILDTPYRESREQLIIEPPP
jgi:tetratricopeptide (TPR) repeat protein